MSEKKLTTDDLMRMTKKAMDQATTRFPGMRGPLYYNIHDSWVTQDMYHPSYSQESVVKEPELTDKPVIELNRRADGSFGVSLGIEEKK